MATGPQKMHVLAKRGLFIWQPLTAKEKMTSLRPRRLVRSKKDVIDGKERWKGSSVPAKIFLNGSLDKSVRLIFCQ